MKTKLIVLVACPLLAFLAYWGFQQWCFTNREVFYNLCELSRAYHHFARAYDGDLPENLDELLDSGFLKAVGPDVYHGPEPEPPEIIPNFHGKRLEYMDALELLFGGNLEDFEVVDGKLVDRHSKEEVIFVRPKRKNLEGFGREHTIRIYEACRE